MAESKKNAGRWVKGQSGNPHGRKPIPDELKKTIRGACQDAVDLWIGLVKDPEANIRDKLMAAEKLMAYGYGKPTEHIEAEVTSDVRVSESMSVSEKIAAVKEAAKNASTE